PHQGQLLPCPHRERRAVEQLRAADRKADIEKREEWWRHEISSPIGAAPMPRMSRRGKGQLPPTSSLAQMGRWSDPRRDSALRCTPASTSAISVVVMMRSNDTKGRAA